DHRTGQDGGRAHGAGTRDVRPELGRRSRAGRARLALRSRRRAREGALPGLRRDPTSLKKGKASSLKVSVKSRAAWRRLELRPARLCRFTRAFPPHPLRPRALFYVPVQRRPLSTERPLTFEPRALPGAAPPALPRNPAAKGIQRRPAVRSAGARSRALPRAKGRAAP